MLPTDLKNYRAEDQFQLVPQEDAGFALAIAVVVLILLECVLRTYERGWL